MGRSFKVGWLPSGNFFKLGPTGTTLQRFRPVFSEPTSDTTSYLETHKSNSRAVPTSVDDGSPRFFLPMAIGNGGDSASHEALYKAISAYAGSGEEIGKQSFSLLSCFVDNEESVAIREATESSLISQFAARQKEAVVRFLIKACRPAVEADIQKAISCGDTHSAILAALVGGDIAQACELAFDMGQEDLAACIGAFDAQGSSDFSEQCRSGTVPQKVRQIYQLLSGDIVGAELGSLDWMRACLVKIVYEEPLNARRGLADVLQSFGQSVATSSALYPSPKYTRGRNTSDLQCILYRLLRLAERPQTSSVCEIVDPSGASRYRHDLALAFHLACCLSAAGISGLSPLEEAMLIDGYCAQLCAAGHWVWAVYVCLCSLNKDTDETWKRNIARDLVLRNFHSEDVNSEANRRFLVQDIGIPKEWLFEALSNRQGRRGDPFTYIQNLAAYAPREASATVDEVILPNLLIMSNADMERSLVLVDAFQSEQSPLSAAMLNLFDVSRDLFKLLSAPREVALEHLPTLAEDIVEIEKVLVARRAEGDKKQSDDIALKFCPFFETVPMSAMLFEASEQCMFLKLQLKAIEMGIPINGEVSKERLTSLLAFEVVEHNEKWASSGVIRALR